MLLTRSRLCPRASPGSSLHLHVLSTPPAFVLSQDQTLREELHKERLAPLEDPPVHMRWIGHLTGLLLSYYWHYFAPRPEEKRSRMRIPCTGPCSGRAGRHLETWTQSIGKEPKDVHAVEFSKTAAPCWRGFLRSFALLPETIVPRRAVESSAPFAGGHPPGGLGALPRAAAQQCSRVPEAYKGSAGNFSDQPIRRRRNLRLPSCRTRPSSVDAGTSSGSAGTGSPSSLTPPWASIRRA